jgi:hypothetical protein
MSHITIHYTCHGCNLEKQAVDVPERAVDADILNWIDQVTEQVSIDHSEREPFCDADSFDMSVFATDESMIGRVE